MLENMEHLSVIQCSLESREAKHIVANEAHAFVSQAIYFALQGSRRCKRIKLTPIDIVCAGRQLLSEKSKFVPESTEYSQMRFHWIWDKGRMIVTEKNSLPKIQGTSKTSGNISDGRTMVLLHSELFSVLKNIRAYVLKGDRKTLLRQFPEFEQTKKFEVLAPFFGQLVYTTVREMRYSKRVLGSVLELVKCLLTSKHLDMENYAHQILPAIITVVTSRKYALDWRGDHWYIREKAVSAFKLFFDSFSEQYSMFIPTILVIVEDVLVKRRRDSLIAQYGMICILGQLGEQAILSMVSKLSNYTRDIVLLKRFEKSTTIFSEEDNCNLLRVQSALIGLFESIREKSAEAKEYLHYLDELHSR